jgi:hypothetical protein
VPVDVPPDVSEPTATRPSAPEAATIAASTMAGGVVDADADFEAAVEPPDQDETAPAPASEVVSQEVTPMAPEPELTAGDGPAESSETGRVDPIVAADGGAGEPQLVRAERASTERRRGFFRRRRPPG